VSRRSDTTATDTSFGTEGASEQASGRGGQEAFLESLFDATPVSPQHRRHELRVSCDDTERLINWLAEPPPGVGYN
jgi:hypothetical protein